MIGNDVPDKTLLQKVNQRLARMGTGSQSRVTATVCRGQVTLSGTIQYALQRRPLVSAVSSVAGIRRVIDQLQEKPRRRSGSSGRDSLTQSVSSLDVAPRWSLSRNPVSCETPGFFQWFVDRLLAPFEK